jgi:hypothetical protein
MRDGDQGPYLVEEFDAGPNGGVKGMQAVLNARAAEGYSLVQAVRRNASHWVIFFERTVANQAVDTGPSWEA